MTTTAPFAISCPTLVRFGEGVSGDLPDFLPGAARRLAVLRGARGIAAQPIIQHLNRCGYDVIEVECPGEPTIASINTAVDGLQQRDVDAIIACGGGAVIDAGKAITFCLSNDVRLGADFSVINPSLLSAISALTLIAIPTTAGTGAEVTSNAVLGVPSQKAKISLRGRALFPAAALVDPLLLASVPKDTALSSGMDAIVQTIEAYTSIAATPFSDSLTTPNIVVGLTALPDAIKNNATARRDMAWVSLSSGLALANSGLGAAHGIASVIGGHFDAPHGALCGRLLAPVLRRNLMRARPKAVAHNRLAECCDLISDAFPATEANDPLSGLEAWLAMQSLPGLADFGVNIKDIDDLAHRSSGASSSKKNAVPLMAEDYAAIIRDAL